MDIVSYQPMTYAYSQGYSNRMASAPSFLGKPPRKLIEKLISTPNNKHVHFTFDEVEKIYNYLGFDVIRKRGSHTVVPLTDEINLTLVIPHGDKHVSAVDIKRLRYVIAGELEKAVSF